MHMTLHLCNPYEFCGFFILEFSNFRRFIVTNIVLLKQDENRYNASRGAHLNLKRAEKARILVNKIPGKCRG